MATTEMQSFYTPSTSSHISSHAPAAVDELISKYSSMSNAANASTATHPRRVTRFCDCSQKCICLTKIL